MNVMNEYIKITKKFITDYFRLILGNKFNRKISDEFLESYIQTRYYETDENTNRNELKKDILRRIEIKKKELIQMYPENKKNIENFKVFYTYVPYFDYVIQTKELEKIINNIYEKRKQILNKEDEEFVEKLLQLEKSHQTDIQEILNKLESNEFYLELKKISEKPEVQEVNLRYNIKFPMLYSEFAIQKAFETGNTNEDKQFVEYYLLTEKVIRDIMQGKMKKQYIVKLIDTILKKKQKLKRLLEIIDNSAMQDKISLKIDYKDFIKNKSNISELIQRGFKIAIVLDNTFEFNTLELKRLEIFQFILIDSTFKYYDEIIKNKNTLNNVIEMKKE